MELGPESLADVEKRHILHIMSSCSGNKTAAAKLLGLARSTLVLKLKGFECPPKVIVLSGGDEWEKS